MDGGPPLGRRCEVRERNRSLRKLEGLRKAWIQFWRVHVTFYRLHLSYFMVLGAIGTLLVWLSPKHNSRIPFIDALFSVTSSLCVTGLFTLRMTQLSRFDKAILMLLMLVGNQVFTSLLPVYVRRYYFSQYIRKNVKGKPKMTRQATGAEKEALASDVPTSIAGNIFSDSDCSNQLQGVVQSVRFESPADNMQDRHDMVHHTWSGESSRKEAQELAVMLRISKALRARLADSEAWASPADGVEDEMCLDLTTAKLLERDALICLSWLVPVYYVGVQLGGFVFNELFFRGAPHALESLKERGVNRIFFSMFTSVSAFANAGITLTDDSMVPFQKSVLLLCNFTVLVLLGNTLFAPCIRLFIWLLYRASKGNRKLVYKYLLKHPRKCYTHLFPRNQTIWLVVTVMAFNAAEFIFFCVLDWRSSALRGLRAGNRIVIGFFQSVSTRSSGFQVILLAELSSAMLVLYVGMMYIAAYPVFLSRQTTKAPREVYDESDLGLYAQNWESELADNKIYVQARKLLTRDSAYLFVSVFLICVIHNGRIKQDPLNFSIFNIIFEVISAYGNVGLSTGYSCHLAREIQPTVACEDVPYSFSGKWNAAGKAILVVVMFLGRHRGLPDSIDSAIRLPQCKEFSVKGTGRLSRFRDPLLSKYFKKNESREVCNFTSPPNAQVSSDHQTPLGQPKESKHGFIGLDTNHNSRPVSPSTSHMEKETTDDGGSIRFHPGARSSTVASSRLECWKKSASSSIT